MGPILKSLGIEPNELVINIVGFLLLVWLLARYMFGPVGEFLERRKQHIAQNLDEAEQAKQAAEAELAALKAGRDAAVAAAEQEAAQVRAAGLADGQAMKDKARAEAGNMVRQAEAEIVRKTQDALISLRGDTASLAVQMCEKLLRSSLNAERHAALVDEFIDDIHRTASEQSA
jgi:F-type H+-transporting ATPase subunit b